MFNLLIILIAVINFTYSQEPPEADDLAILSGLSTASLQCSLKFDREFVAENEAIAAAIEDFFAQRGDDTREKRGRRKDKTDESEEVEEATEAPADLELRRNLRKGNRRGDTTREPKDATREPRERKSRDDSTREPKDVTRGPRDSRKGRNGRKSRKDDEATEDSEDDLELRRNLRKGKRRGGRRGDDDSTREPKDVTRAPKDVTREPKDATREPCDSDDCRRKGRKRGRKSREDDEASEESEDDLELRRNLRKGKRRGGRRRGDDDSTREPKDGTREPKDATREPCDDDNCQRRKGRKGGRKSRKDDEKRRGRGDSDDSSDELETTQIPPRRLLRDETERDVDSTKEPCDRTQEPCDGEDCRRGRKGGRGRKSRKDEVVTTEAPEDVLELRRALGEKDGRRKRRKGVDATISNGQVDIAGVTGEVVFGDVDQTLESIPLTLTIGETTFQCDVEVRRGKKVSCVAVSDDDFRVRVGCELEL